MFFKKSYKFFTTYIYICKKKPHDCEALCSSVVQYLFTTGMVNNVGYALGAVACSPTNQAIYIALADGVV
jgi:hypothetical protein